MTDNIKQALILLKDILSKLDDDKFPIESSQLGYAYDALDSLLEKLT